MREIMIPKVIVMYLPQFHRTPENDEWWGEGFTDWVSARNAKPLFEGHYQPHIPLNDNYYDLLDKKTMQWQADLMHKYGIDGICMYHYWFKDSRRILEKPEQNLLEWKDIDMPFCFCWANESWARSWTHLFSMTRKGANIWNFDSDNKQKQNPILLQQSYGLYDQWKKHLDYLMPFFMDERYIKIDGAPVFVIYKPNEIKCLSEMIIYWKKMAKAEGLADICIVGINCDDASSDYIDISISFEPLVTIWRHYNDIPNNPIKMLDFDNFIRSSLEEKPNWRKCFFGGTVGYDDTPRRGNKGKCIVNNTPEKFNEYTYNLLRKNSLYGNEYLFINAWNEWGEGMHLEPDKKYSFKYLEALHDAISKTKNLDEKVAIFQADNNDYEKRQIYSERIRVDKNELYLKLMDQWMNLAENEKSISNYLSKNGYKKIVIYGFGMLGQHLYYDLVKNGVGIVGIVDERAHDLNVDCNLFLPNDELPKYDCFVITSVFYKDEILRKLNLDTIHDVISIDHIIDEILTEDVVF